MSVKIFPSPCPSLLLHKMRIPVLTPSILPSRPIAPKIDVRRTWRRIVASDTDHSMNLSQCLESSHTAVMSREMLDLSTSAGTAQGETETAPWDASQWDPSMANYRTEDRCKEQIVSHQQEKNFFVRGCASWMEGSSTGSKGRVDTVSDTPQFLFITSRVIVD